LDNNKIGAPNYFRRRYKKSTDFGGHKNRRRRAAEIDGSQV
jgi:hypothetical protein